jgi:hypothetical protein
MSSFHFFKMSSYNLSACFFSCHFINYLLISSAGLSNNLPFCKQDIVSFYQLAILQIRHLPMFHFVNLPFCKQVILSMCHFINLSLCQLIILSTCNFVKNSFCQCVILSTCHFVSLSFSKQVIL